MDGPMTSLQITLLLIGALVALAVLHDLRRADSRLAPRLRALAHRLGLSSDVIAVAARPEHGECELTLTVRDRGDLTGFEILRRYAQDAPFEPVAMLPVGARVARVELPPFHTHEYLVRAVRLDGSLTEGARAQATGVHRRIVMRKVGDRPLQVYLPEEAADPTRRFPVVYFLDGQNTFCDCTSYCGAWRADTVLEGLAKRGLAGPMIAVGVYNGPARAAEYVPYVDAHFTSQTGVTESRADAFVAFLADEVIPFVEAEFPALPGRDNRMIAGSSFGGICALWAGFTRPDAFSTVGALSPSVWVGSGAIFRDLPPRGNPGLKVWLDVGTAEWSPVHHLAALLAERGFAYGRDLFYLEDEGAEHHERFWGARLASPLILFKGRPAQRIVAFEPVLERIPSRRGAEELLRINALATFDNGMRATLLAAARYESSDPSVVRALPSGDLEFLGPGRATVTVRAGGFEKRLPVESPLAASEPLRETVAAR